VTLVPLFTPKSPRDGPDSLFAVTVRDHLGVTSASLVSEGASVQQMGCLLDPLHHSPAKRALGADQEPLITIHLDRHRDSPSVWPRTAQLEARCYFYYSYLVALLFSRGLLGQRPLVGGLILDLFCHRESPRIRVLSWRPGLPSVHGWRHSWAATDTYLLKATVRSHEQYHWIRESISGGLHYGLLVQGALQMRSAAYASVLNLNRCWLLLGVCCC
jgi:hypothetical protein